MKYLYLYLLLLVTHISFAQDYPAFKFKTIKSQWDYFAIDTNFVKDDLNLHRTKYSSVYTSEFFSKNEKLLILQYSFSSDNFIQNNGYLLHQIDSRSGEVNWIKFNNTNNKNYKLNKYGQSDVINRSFINDKNQAVILTRVSKDTIRKDGFSPLYFNFNYAEAVFDLKDGRELETKIGKSNNKSYLDCTNCLNQLYVRGMGDYCHISYNYGVKNKLTYEQANFYALTTDMDIDTNTVQSLEYNTSISSSRPYGDYADFYSQLNKDTIVLLNFVVYPEDLDYNPEQATLRWIDISDKEVIKEVHELDIKPYYILPDRNFYKEQPNVKTLNNNIIVSQRIFADKANPFKGTYWVLWLDAKGNTRSSVRSLRVGTRVYELIYPYTVKGDRLYLMGEYTDGKESGIDLVEIHAGTDEVRTTTNLVNYPHLNGTRRIAPLGGLWITEEHSAFGFRMFKDTTNLQSEYFYYIGVRNQDLGIVSSVDELVQTIDCTIYPNPTVDQVTISFGTAYTGTLRLQDVHGRTVVPAVSLTEIDDYNLSLSDLPSGVYYLQLSDGRGGTHIVGRPLIKM